MAVPAQNLKMACRRLKVCVANMILDGNAGFCNRFISWHIISKHYLEVDDIR